MSKTAAAQTTVLELRGTKFYVPKTWTVSLFDSVPPYNAASAATDNAAFTIERGFLLLFPVLPSHLDWLKRYPEIAPPFIYELAITPGMGNLDEARRQDRGLTYPEIARRIEAIRADSEGFKRLSESYYVDGRVDAHDGAGGYLQFSCRPGLIEKDRGILSRCTVEIYVLDGLLLRASFDGLDFSKSRWRDVVQQINRLVRWLTMPPSQRPEKIN